MNKRFKSPYFKNFLKIYACLILMGIFNFAGRVFAATGDYATFSEIIGLENIAQSPSVTDITWDNTVVNSSGTYTLQANTFDIDLADSGKYLVMYSIPTVDITTVDSERTDSIAWLELAGTDLAYGYSQGYIRRAGSNFEGYNSGAAIIEASAGDDLSVEMQRRDTNTDTTERRANKSGISLLKLDDTWDYLRLRVGTRSSDISGNTSFFDMSWDTQDEVDTGSFEHSTGTNPDEITLKGAAGDHFLVTTNVSLNQDASSNNRQNYEMRLALDGAEIEGTRVTTYVRGNPNTDGTYNGVLSYSGIIAKASASDEILTIQLRRESQGSASTDIVNGETAISIVKLPITADYIMLGETGGGQDLATTRTVVTWDDTIEEDSGSFEHDTTNTSRINIDSSGDYLFFSTMYASRTTSGTRETQFLEWRLDGSTLIGYGNHGAFNRGDQSTTDAYTSGSSGGVLLNGLADTQYVELTQINEAGAGPSTYQAGLMSLQGVNIDSLFASAADTRQLHFRWRDDTTDLNTSGGWLAAEDSNSVGTVVPNDTYRLRMSTANIGGLTESSARTYELQWGEKPQAGACADISSWTGIADASDDVDMVATTHIDPDGESTSSGLLANSEGYTYVSGEGRESADTTGSIGPLAGSRYTELEYSFEMTTNATLGGTYCFRLYDTTAGAELNAYNVYPELTLVEPLISQLHFRWRDDSTALNTSGGWLATEDSNSIGAINRYDTYRIRFETSNTGNYQQLNGSAYELEWETMPSSGSCSDISTWTGVGDATDEFAMVDSAQITSDGQSITTGLLANSELYSFENGEARDLTDTTSTLTTLGINDYTEVEFSIQATEEAITGETYCFRLYDSNNGRALDAYSVYPTVTLESSLITNEPNMEWGLEENVTDDAWTTINFTSSYTDPVFVCTVEYQNNIGNESDGDADSVVCRTRNVGATSAEVMLQEPGAPGSLTDAENVHWIVVEAGTYNTSEIKLEAFTYTSTVTDTASSWVGEVQSYSQSYTSPVVLGQVMTYNDSNYSVFWAHDGAQGVPTAANLYTGKHVAEDPTTTRADETVGVIVFEQGNGSIGGIEYEVYLQGQTIDRIDDVAPSSYTFNQSFTSTPEVGIVSLAGISGVNGAHPVLYNDGNGVFTTSTIDLVVMEEEINDTEQNGNTEAVPYIVFGTAGSSSVSLDQTNFRFYENVDSTLPTVALGTENSGITDIGAGKIVRLRLALQAGLGNLSSGSQSFKLQYGAGNDCTTGITWQDVDGISGSGIWRGYDNATPADGTTLGTSLLIAQSNALQTYEEENNSATNPNTITEGNWGEWDFVLQNNGAIAGTNYCFRVVTSTDDTLVYSIYPTINTSNSTLTQQDFEWYVEESTVTTTNVWPNGNGIDIAENAVITQLPASNKALAFGDRIRIQINFSVGTSPMTSGDLAFKLQYAEATDCSVAGGWQDVGAKGSGTIWRLYDESGLSDTVTQVNQISTSTGGAEGNYSEILPTATNPNDVAIGEYSEWDWPIQNNGATDNASYCFRMIRSDDSAFESYTNYPRLFTHPGMTTIMRHGNFYRDDSEQGFVWAD